MSEFLTSLHAGVLHHDGCGLSCFNVLRMQRRRGFVLKPCLVCDFFFAWTPSFTFGHTKGLLCCYYSPQRIVSVSIPEQHMKWSCFQQLPLRVYCEFRELSEQVRIDDMLSAKVLFRSLSARASHFILWDLRVLQVYVGFVGFSRRKLQTTRWWSVDSSAQFLTQTPNNEWNKSAETTQNAMSGRWPKESLHWVYLYKPLLEESVNYAQYVITAQLQQESSVIINSITLSADQPLHTPASYPVYALKSPKRIVGSLILTHRKASLISSTNSGHSALEYGLYTCIKHRERLNNFHLNRHTLPSNPFIQFASWWLRAIPTPARENFACATPVYSRWVATTVLEPRRFVDELSITSGEYRFASSTSSCCEWGDVPVSTLHSAHSPSQMRIRRKWGLLF